MTKWAARFALGLSNSVPGPLLDPSNILDEPDISLSHGPSYSCSLLKLLHQSPVKIQI